MVVKSTKLICFGVISTIILFLWILRLAWASPFLVCDPQAGVEEYEVVIEEAGVPVMGGIVPAEPDTTVRYDLATIPNGTYIAKIKAGNIWGWSDWSQPFGFVVERCNPPLSISIVP